MGLAHVKAAVVVGLIALVPLISGAMGFSGKFLRMDSRAFMGNFTAQLLFGLALLGAAALSLLKEGSTAADLVGLPVVLLFALGLWSLFVRPPRWLQPAWQREMDDEDRRA